MSKETYINAIQQAGEAEEVKLSKKAAEAIWKQVQSTIVSELRADQEVPIDGLGKLIPDTRAARIGRNPQTGETIQIKASRVVKVKLGSKWKQSQ
ncbi:HU family DNA-binding protein [Alicyclobacillus fodiniaquatilis]|uniref:HU family DNA-binding protein n=1 Tax=Alicyclobacillus fodiniaquatilis TaxID=1661150 RepID=A0ABW4JLT8_9BACL